MAENTAFESFLTCPICLEIFKDPVSLSCNHSFCQSCIQYHWAENQTRNCAVCRRKSSKDNTFINFGLKELCKSYAGKPKTDYAKEWREMDKDQLTSELHSLKKQQQSYSDLETTYNEMVQFCRKQSVQCERRIRAEFSRLQSFLQEEEQRALSALREEQLRQTHIMGPELQKVREKLNSLNNSIKELEKHLQTDSSSPQPQSPAPRLRPKAGLLLDQAKVLGNLSFRAWRNMRSIVSYSPVILDPNTAEGWLYLSEDLRGVRRGDTGQKVPDNPERFTNYTNVLGSEGYSSGIHQWDVEVGDHPNWIIGVSRESVDRKGKKTASPKNGLWCLFLDSGKYTNYCDVPVPVKTRLQRIRVKLDYDLGEVSFYDTDHMTHLYTYSDTFTEKIFPYFSVGKAGDALTKELRILPSDDTKDERSSEGATGTKHTSFMDAFNKLFKK